MRSHPKRERLRTVWYMGMVTVRAYINWVSSAHIMYYRFSENRFGFVGKRVYPMRTLCVVPLSVISDQANAMAYCIHGIVTRIAHQAFVVRCSISSFSVYSTDFSLHPYQTTVLSSSGDFSLFKSLILILFRKK
jgi:hypothetical protein